MITKARVLFAYRLKNGLILKVRLNKNLLEIRNNIT